MSDELLLIQTYDLLYHLGLTANYSGFFHTARAVLLAAKEPQRLTGITKWLYPDVADHYHTTWHAVERNIRYSISILWEAHPNRLSNLAGYLLPDRPTPAKFISLLASQIS